ncbi:MAG TPA: DUF1800 domain-containing protein [Spirochaetia bacterium]|nr:DUF1800 domain-containing protein [Spirochaetia bacterium]
MKQLSLAMILFPCMVSGLFALSPADAAFLLQRTGFNATPMKIAALAPLSRDEAIRAIVDQAAASVQAYAVAPPPWTKDSPDLVRRLRLKGIAPAQAAERRKTYQEELRRRSIQLQEWDIEEMVHAPSPFAERMVLFWHNNFTSSLAKVRDPGLLFNQDRIIRKYAFGSFSQMLRAVAKDPAMIVYLDNETNSKGKPNENFAREVMELFTLGEGNYTEPDVKASARAFTGWRVNYRTATYQFDRRLHDNGVKTFLGHTGNLGGDDILTIILQQPAAALFLTDKLWREFISPNPDQPTVERLAESFRSSGYQIEPLLIQLLETQAFWAPANREMLVKSPVDLVVGTVRSLGVDSINPILLVRATRELGQDLFNPPTVKGWPVGVGWINSQTLILRHEVLSRLIAADAAGLKKSLLTPAYQLY